MVGKRRWEEGRRGNNGGEHTHDFTKDTSRGETVLTVTANTCSPAQVDILLFPFHRPGS